MLAPFYTFWQRRFEYFDVFDLIGSDKRKWPDDRIENCWTKNKFCMKMKFKDLRVIDIIQIVPSKEDCKFKDMWVKIYLFPFPVCLPDLCSIFKIALYLTHISDILLIYLYMAYFVLFCFFIFVIYLLIIFQFMIYGKEGSGYQIRWIFGKNPNGLWPPLIFGKLYCNFLIMDMVESMQGGMRAK